MLRVDAAEIAPGVTYTQYSLTNPNNKVYVVAFDRFRAEYKLTLGWSEQRRNYANRQTVRTIAGLYNTPPAHEVLAAINGSLFSWTNPGVTGMAASNGEVLEQPGGTRETFLWGPSRTPAIVENLSTANGTLTFADGSTTTLHGYNRARTPNAIVAYTTQWAASTGTVEQGVEVLLTNVSYPMRGDKEISGLVTAVRTAANSPNNSIPAGGMVLSATGTPVSAITGKISVGDRLRVRIDTTASECNNADMAVTGLGWILRGGMANIGNWLQYDSLYAARDPYTVLAWNSSKCFLVVCDGRTTASVGMSFQERAEFLANTLGATDAISLDGGGSSTMVVDGVLKNVPSDGSERAVANAVMLVRQDTSTAFPFADPFTAIGRLAGWDDKFHYNPVEAFSPASPGGDGYALVVSNPQGGAETIRRGDFGDTNYGVEADIYCEYRPVLASDGYERYGIFARDDGRGAFGLANVFGRGNCYALTYDSDTGRLQAGRYVNGTLLDSLATPLFLSSSAWRRFSIECQGSLITYRVDGSQIARINDTTFSRGCLGIGYYESFATNSNIHGTRADNLNAFALPQPTKATVPDPTQYASAVSRTTALNWSPGAGAVSHNVYFGTTNPPAFRGNQAGTTYAPAPLTHGTTYYWRIDEVSAMGTTIGDLWRFTVGLPPAAWTAFHEPFLYPPYSTASPSYKYDPLAATLNGQANPYSGLLYVTGNIGSGYDAYMIPENLDPPAPLPPSLGGMAVIYNGSAANNGITTRIQPGGSEGMLVRSGTLYYSLMLKVFECPALDPPNNGGFHAGFNNTPPTAGQGLSFAAARLRLRRTAVANRFQIGIESDTGDGSTLVWDPGTYDSFTPIFIVVGYEMKNNTGTAPVLTDDISHLWINPSPASFGQSVPPAANATSTGADSQDGMVRSFFIRSQAGGTPSRVGFDDLHIGTSWAAVTSATICEPPTVTSVRPASVVAGHAATGVVVTGSGFVPGISTIRLTMAGRSDILATNIHVTGPGYLTCDLDLTTASVGNYDVAVSTCATGIPSRGLDVTPPQDLDGDGDVDANDIGLFASCLTGSGLPHNATVTCERADFDHDNDVDMDDFSRIQLCFSGHGVAMELDCAD